MQTEERASPARATDRNPPALPRHSGRGWKFPAPPSSNRLLSARFIFLLLAFRAPICLPVIWTNVDGQKQAGLSFLPPLPFSFFLPPPHYPAPARTSREKDEQLTHKINTRLTVSDKD